MSSQAWSSKQPLQPPVTLLGLSPRHSRDSSHSQIHHQLIRGQRKCMARRRQSCGRDPPFTPSSRPHVSAESVRPSHRLVHIPTVHPLQRRAAENLTLTVEMPQGRCEVEVHKNILEMVLGLPGVIPPPNGPFPLNPQKYR